MKNTSSANFTQDNPGSKDPLHLIGFSSAQKKRLNGKLNSTKPFSYNYAAIWPETNANYRHGMFYSKNYRH